MTVWTDYSSTCELSAAERGLPANRLRLVTPSSVERAPVIGLRRRARRIAQGP